MSVFVLAAGDAPYCTPELYKECADPALGKKEAPSTSESLKSRHTHTRPCFHHFRGHYMDFHSFPADVPPSSDLIICII